MQDRSEISTTEDFKALARNPNTQASVLLTVGPLFWKWISYISNVDFLLNITGEKFNMFLNFLQGPGWLLLSLGGAIWFLRNYVRRNEAEPRHTPTWGLLLSTVVVAFMFGILLAVDSTGAVPKTIMSWGSTDPNSCVATVDTSKLVPFKKDYKVAVICGLQDPTKDFLDNETITVSNAYNITGAAVAMQTPIREGMKKVMNEAVERTKAAMSQANITVAVPTWYEVVLLPNEVSVSKIAKLSDVLSLKGKILNAQYFN